MHVLFMPCTCDVHVLFMPCTCDVHVLFMCCTSDVHVLFMPCTRDVHVLFMCCTCDVHVLLITYMYSHIYMYPHAPMHARTHIHTNTHTHTHTHTNTLHVYMFKHDTFCSSQLFSYHFDGEILIQSTYSMNRQSISLPSLYYPDSIRSERHNGCCDGEKDFDKLLR